MGIKSNQVSYPADWITGTYYKVNSLIVNNGKTYLCSINHTSGATFDADLAANKWGSMGGDPSNWVTGTYYKVNNLVVYNSKTYLCLVDHIAGATFTIDLAANKWGAMGGVSYTEITADTLMTTGNGYIINKAATVCTLTLPVTANAGDILVIVGKGATGWTIYSNASAATQKILRQGSTSPISNNNSIELLKSANINDTVYLLCTTANSIWTVLSAEGLTGWNYFGDGSLGDVTISSTTSFTSLADSDMIVKNYNNLTINSSVTVSNRCRGLLIYCKGDLTINSGGSIVMTARGANVDPTLISPAVNANGLRIVRFTTAGTDSLLENNLMNGCGAAAFNAENLQPSITGNGKIFSIARTMANGAAAATGININGGIGTSGSPNCCGGGGRGSIGAGTSSTAGAGGHATCFSGGAGSGGSAPASGAASTNAGSSIGGGGSQANKSGIGAGGGSAGGGAGNPGGPGITGSGLDYNPPYKGEDGTGGLLICIVKGNFTLNSGGSIMSKGAKGGLYASGYASLAIGGGSGGGAVLIIQGGTYTNSGSINVDGGLSGASDANGAGGAGSIQAGIAYTVMK